MRRALPEAHGNRGRRNPRQGLTFLTRPGRRKPFLPVAQSDPDAHRHHLSPKYEAMRNSKNNWSIHEAGMAQLDDDIGIVMKKLKDMGVDDNTIVVFTPTTAPKFSPGRMADRRRSRRPRGR